MKHLSFLRAALCGLLCLTAFVGVRAQSSDYRAELTRWLEKNPSITPGALRAGHKMVMDRACDHWILEVGGDSAECRVLREECEKRLEAYLAGPYLADMADVLMPCFRKHLTVEQLASLNRRQYTEAGLTAVEHIRNSPRMDAEELMAQLYKGFEAIMQGTVPELPAGKPCTERYKQLFDAYWQLAPERMELEAIINRQEEQAGKEPADSVELQRYVQQKQYVVALGGVAVRNSFIGTVTEEDLAFKVELYASVEGALYLEVEREIIADRRQWEGILMRKCADWATTPPPAPAAEE